MVKVLETETVTVTVTVLVTVLTKVSTTLTPCRVGDTVSETLRERVTCNDGRNSDGNGTRGDDDDDMMLEAQACVAGWVGCVVVGVARAPWTT